MITRFDYNEKNKLNMIKTIGLSKIFRTESVQTTALNEVSLEINQGEFVAIMGSIIETLNGTTVHVTYRQNQFLVCV